MLKRNSLLYYLLAGALAGLLLVLFLFLYFPPYDYSYRQTADRRTFGSVMQTLADPYYEAVDDKLRALAESKGDVLISRDARQHADKQLEQVYELLEQQPDGIFVSAVDWVQLAPALEAAEKAGVPVVALDAAPGLQHTSATVSTDPDTAGALCAEDLAARLPQARILVLGQPGNRYSDTFATRFREALPEGCTIIGEGDGRRQLAASSRVGDELLEACGGEVDAVVAVNDQSAVGALAALERRGLQGKVLVYGMDGSPQARAAIQKGMMTGTVNRDPYRLAQLAGDAMYALLDDGVLEENAMHVDVKLITEENIGQYELTSWQ